VQIRLGSKETLMHNTDRTQLEYEQDAYEAERGQAGCRCSSTQSSDMVLNEVEEMELAAEFLEIHDEEELDQFLGKLIKRVGRRIKKFVKTPVGGALMRALKGAAVAAVPGLAPVIGAAGVVKSALGRREEKPEAEPPAAAAEPTTEDAGEIFGMELEGLSPEDQEFEVARRFVRFGAEAAAQAADAEEGEAPERTVEQAVNRSAAQHAPGLMRRRRSQQRGGGSQNQPEGRGERSGRWIRRGRQIILLDV
jgi:hypothetical protein